MAILKHRCPNCGSEIVASVGQAVVDRRLVWHMGYSCREPLFHCHHRPPSLLRQRPRA